MNHSPYSKESVRVGILHYLLGRGLAGFAGFATVILQVRYMDVQGYAGFTALTGLIALVGVLAGLGLERAISRYVPEARLARSAKELGQFIWHMSAIRLIAALVACVGFYLLWQPILKVFPDVYLVKFPVALVFFVIAETLFQHFSSVFQALVKQKALTRILIVQWLGRLVMIMFAIQNDQYMSLNESLWVMALPELAGVIVFIVVLLNYLNDLKKSSVQQLAQNTEVWPDWRNIYKMASHNYGFTLLAAPPQGYFMKMLAAAFLPTQMVAAYGFFINIAERARQYIPLHLLYNLIEPVMIGNYLQNRDFTKLSSRCQLLYKSNIILLIPALVLVAAAGSYLIASLTGGKYQEYQWLLMVVMLQLIVGSHVVLLQLIINSLEVSYLLVKAGVVALIAMVVFLGIALPINPQLLVIAPLIFSLACNLYIIQMLRNKDYPYHLPWQLFCSAGFSGAIAYLITYMVINQQVLLSKQVLISQHSLMTTMLSTGLIAIIYLLGLYFFKAISTSEIVLVKSLLSKNAK